MKANKKITGEFTLTEYLAVPPFQIWLNENRFDYTKKGLTFKIDKLSDETFDLILVTAQKFDEEANPQMDLFNEQNEPKDVTSDPSLIEMRNDTVDGDFEETNE